jgi:iron complex outermembrane receptor protein
MNTKYILIVLALLCTVVQAQQTPKYKELMAMNLGDMLNVKVATGTDKQLSEAPAVVSVITAEDIKATGARTLAEAVERIPGLHVMLSSFRFANNFTVRGIQTAATPQILVLMDGMTLSDISANAVPYSFRLPTTFIARIEIIRGPGSAVHGADAFSGVINIITKSPEQSNQIAGGGKVGSFDYQELWLNANVEVNDITMAFSITREEHGNDDNRTTPYGVLKRNRTLNNLHLNLQYGDFSMKNWYWDIEQYLGAGINVWANEADLDINKAYASQLNWQTNLSDNLQISVDLAYSFQKSDTNFNLFPSGTYPVGDDGNLFTGATLVNFPNAVIGNPGSDRERINLSSAWVYSGIKQHRLRLELGLERNKNTNIREIKNFGPGILDTANIPVDFISDTLVDVTGTSYVYSPNYQRDIWFVSVQDEWKLAANWELTAGIRFDDYSDFGSTTNPRVALVWSTTETLTSKLLFGTAFRAPKVSELTYINNPAALGNPDLEPENIQTIELAFDYRPTKHVTGLLNIFSYQAEDLIAVAGDGIYQNTGQQDGHGIEVEGKWQATSQLQLSANMSWLKAELPLTNEDISQVPGVMSYLDVRYQITDTWKITSQAYYVGSRDREAGDTRVDVGDYTKLDVALSWHPNSVWDVQLGAKNLLDEDIRSPSPNSGLFAAGLGFPDDYPMNSRSVYASVSMTFE